MGQWEVVDRECHAEWGCLGSSSVLDTEALCHLEQVKSELNELNSRVFSVSYSVVGP